jgi:hypothetical protein
MAELAMNALEQPFRSLGIVTPTGRFFVMASLGGLFEWYFRPFYSYDSDGKPLSFALLNPGDPLATVTPPGTTALVLGLIFSVFI